MLKLQHVLLRSFEQPLVQVAEMDIEEKRSIQKTLVDIVHMAEELAQELDGDDPDQISKQWDRMTQVREKAKQGLALIEP